MTTVHLGSHALHAEAWAEYRRAYLQVGDPDRVLLEIQAPSRSQLEALRDAIDAALEQWTDYDEPVGLAPTVPGGRA